jgi:hypothetical protein
MTYGASTPEVAATLRMQNINLFTLRGNGDDYIDVDETAEFLTISSGGRKVLDQAILMMNNQCKVSSFKIQQQLMPITCLQTLLTDSRFFQSLYGAVVPEAVRQFTRWSEVDRRNYITYMLNAANPAWETATDLKYAEMETMIGIPYYTENIFDRIDQNNDQVIRFSEVMRFFPLFCREIKKAAGPSIKGSCEPGESPNQIEAIFGHLLFYGVPPRGIQEGDGLWTKFKEIKNFLLWVREWKRLNKDPEVRDVEPPELRRGDILKIIANLAIATAPQTQSAR